MKQKYKHYDDVLHALRFQDGVSKRILEIEDNLQYLKQVCAQAADEIERLRSKSEVGPDIDFAYRKIYLTFFKNLWKGWEITYDMNVKEESEEDKMRMVSWFLNNDKFTAKKARDILEIIDYDSLEWKGKEISTIVKRLNRLKNAYRKNPDIF